MKNALLFSVLSVCTIANGIGVFGQEERASKTKRVVYNARFSKASDMATVLSKHFKDEVEVQIVSEPTSNCLLISATSAAFDEVLRVLERIDRQPQLVSVDLWIAVLPNSNAIEPKREPAAPEFDPQGLSGPIEEVNSKIQELRQNVRIGDLKQIQFVALENQPTSVKIGDSKPYVSGRTMTANGAVNNISFFNLGTMLELTLRVNPDDEIAFDLKIDDMSQSKPEKGVEVATEENGTAIHAPEVNMASLKGKLTIRSGQAVMAQGVKIRAKHLDSQTVIVVGGRIVQPAGRATK